MMELPNIDYIHNKLLLIFQMKVMGQEKIFNHLKMTFFSIFFEKKVEVHSIEGVLHTIVFTHYYRFTVPGIGIVGSDLTTQTQRVVEVFNLHIGNGYLELITHGINEKKDFFRYILDREGKLVNYEDSDGNYYNSDLMSDDFMFTYPMDIINKLIDGLETTKYHYAVPTPQAVADEFDKELCELRDKYQEGDLLRWR